MLRAARSRAAGTVRRVRRKVSGSRLWFRSRAASIPPWVIGLAVSAVVGASSAVATVAGLGRLRKQSQQPIEIPIQEENAQERV